MILKGIIDTDFINYKKICMVLEFPFCSFKCGNEYCQNSNLVNAPNIEISATDIAIMYNTNHITEAIVCQGLEPFDSFIELYEFIYTIRELNNIHDDIVIYTGYTKQELENTNILTKLKKYDNIIIKYGRYIPNQQEHFDEVLGVYLASDNQYAERIS